MGQLVSDFCVAKKQNYLTLLLLIKIFGWLKFLLAPNTQEFRYRRWISVRARALQILMK